MKAMYIVMRRTMGSVKRILRGLDTFFTRSSLKSTSISSCLAWMPQFLVARRRADAFDTKIMGAYVSSRKKKLRIRAENPMNEEMYIVHLQPR